MANGPALSTASGGEIYVGSEIRDSLTRLDVLYANHFEGESCNPILFAETEENFYRGAPPEWLNFHISEKAVADGSGTPFIKRDGYDTLVHQINQRRKRPGISTVKLFHQPGCGGTTLAMQVLWDLRKTFRCAVLTGSTSDMTKVAEKVVHLFTAGSRGHQNTVLLLLNDEQILENLQDSIMMKIAEKKIVTHKIPVAILLSCVRKDAVIQSDHVALERALSDTEKQNFDEKKKELSRNYSDKHKQFHGFNIMQTNFSQDYVKQACEVFSKVKGANRPKKTQLAAFLALLNAYVPGSYLLETQCLNFLKHDESIHGGLSLEDRMQPFSHLIITYQPDETSERRVRMAHRMIAQHCTELMAERGVSRSDTARNLLTCLCRGDVPQCLIDFVKDMLTKREMKQVSSTEMKDKQEKFSRLIQDIQKGEEEEEKQQEEQNEQNWKSSPSASVLKVATKRFDEYQFFPQALARVYYIKLKKYNQAERWAKEAKMREKKKDCESSFVADTLGQVHKNHLKYLNNPKSTATATPREILQLATKAIEAFKHEEQLAEKEHGLDKKRDGMAKVSNVFNTRGQLGYLQVCNILYDLLVRHNTTWREVLTKNVSMSSVLKSLGDNTLLRFNDLINSLRDEVERKCAFFDKYLTYSKPDMNKDDASCTSRDTSDCYRKYVGDSPLKHVTETYPDFIQEQNLAETSAGVLSCLDRECTESELKEITTCWEEIYSSNDSSTALVNCILAHMMLINMGVDLPSKQKYLAAFKKKMPLSPKEAPEHHMLALLLYWPANSEEKCVFDISQLVQHMHCSYEHAYKTYFRSRYLRPLFFIGKGQGLNRIVHRKVLEGLFLGQNKEAAEDWSNWNDDKIFQDPKVQDRLLRVEGVVRNYSLHVTIGVTEIKVDVNVRNSVWKPRQVSFYLGFTIRGPVAFGIQTKTAEKEISAMDVSEPGQINPKLSARTGTTEGDYRNQSCDHEEGQHFVDRHRTALIERVSDVGSILDKLMDKKLISNEAYDSVRALKTTQDQMREILKYVISAGTRGKDIFYEIIKGRRSLRPLITELEESG